MPRMERLQLCSLFFILLLLALVSLDLTSWAWTAPNCIIADSLLFPNLSYYIQFCTLAPGLHLLASCTNVKDMAQTLERVPRDTEVLCLQGMVSFLPDNAFDNFHSLQLLRLQLGTINITSRTFQGLDQLQYLFFEHHAPCCLSLFLPPNCLKTLKFLRSLSFQGYCLNYSQNIYLPTSLKHLTLRNSCLTKLQELQRFFPSLLLGSSPTSSTTLGAPFLEVLDLSYNLQLKQADVRALHGLKLLSLILDGTTLRAFDLTGSGLLHLDFLSLVGTGIEKLPGTVTGYSKLRALDLGKNQIQNILENGDIPSYKALEFLGLHDNHLQSLPIRFLRTLPQLQKLNLSMNKLGPTLEIPEGVFSTNLRVLDLSHNQLCDVPHGAFLPQLQELWLSGNNISSLSNVSMQGLRGLRTLDLSWNQIKVLKPGWLSHLSALTTLNLLGTYLEHISGIQLQGPQMLRHLKLGSVTMLDIYPPWFPMLLSLEIQAQACVQFMFLSGEPFLFLENLTLQTSNVLRQPDTATIHFPSLRRLTLRGYSLIISTSQLQRFFPQQLPLLEHFSIWCENDNAVDLNLFGMPRLRVLEFGYLNFFYESSTVKLEMLLKEVPQLQALALSHLNLRNLSVSSIKGLHHLKLLLLSSELSLEMDGNLQEFIPQMPPYVYFSDVTFTCQCEASWVESWATQAPNTFVYGLEKSICMANTSDYSNTLLFSFLATHCPHDTEFWGFLISFTLILLLTILPLVGCHKWSWLHYLQTLLRACWWKLGGHRLRGQFNYDVFISYCEKDQAWVLEELVPGLEKPPPKGEGLRLCLPARDFGIGNDRMESMIASMHKSRSILCVLTGQALASPWCNLELRLATYHLVARPGTARLLLLFLEPIDRQKLHGYHRLSRWLKKEDYFDLSQGEVDWDTFCEQLKRQLRKAGQERED
ncbi:toll-like receptor 11 [Phodopus roborovskii]|uniref:Tlr11 protein n=1 Tax=Phodopus roborovskii TaxID=109678 RepID=A0AAU9YW12_PHORO|nr:toll-like receptor 11 [Phodopus roborovskii]CAH6778969.1 Tlr11 [Phodopus roborovskii]